MPGIYCEDTEYLLLYFFISFTHISSFSCNGPQFLHSIKDMYAKHYLTINKDSKVIGEKKKETYGKNNNTDT